MSYEHVYADAMKALAKREGRTGKLPIKFSGGGPERTDITEAIMEVLVGEMTALQIAHAAGEKLGCRVDRKSVSYLLGTTLSSMVTYRRHFADQARYSKVNDQ